MSNSEDIVYRQIETDYSRSGFREDIVEDAAIGIFEELGYAYAPAGQIAPDGSAPERDAYSDTILEARLKAAVERNPTIPADARAEAIKQLFVNPDRYECDGTRIACQVLPAQSRTIGACPSHASQAVGADPIRAMVHRISGRKLGYDPPLQSGSGVLRSDYEGTKKLIFDHLSNSPPKERRALHSAVKNLFVVMEEEESCLKAEKQERLIKALNRTKPP